MITTRRFEIWGSVLHFRGALLLKPLRNQLSLQRWNGLFSINVSLLKSCPRNIAFFLTVLSSSDCCVSLPLPFYFLSLKSFLCSLLYFPLLSPCERLSVLILQSLPTSDRACIASWPVRALHQASCAFSFLWYLQKRTFPCGFLVAQTVKSPPARLEIWGRSLGWEDPLEKEMATHPGILAWRIPMDRGTWWTTAHGVAQSWIGWSDQVHTRKNFPGCFQSLSGYFNHFWVPVLTKWKGLCFIERSIAHDALKHSGEDRWVFQVVVRTVLSILGTNGTSKWIWLG